MRFGDIGIRVQLDVSDVDQDTFAALIAAQADCAGAGGCVSPYEVPEGII